MKYHRHRQAGWVLYSSIIILSLIGISLARHFQKISDQEPRVVKAVPDTSPDREDLLTTIISQMTDSEKIGQLMMVNYFGNDLKLIQILMDELSVSGIMLLGENVEGKSYEQLRDFNHSLQTKSQRIPIFLSVDQEGGDVARITRIIREYPYPSRVYSQKGKQGIKEQAEYYSEKLRDLNININFSPVLDIVLDEQSIIAERSFSHNGDINAELGRLYIDIFRKSSLIAVPKHFPGYGSVSLDPHYAVCRDNVNRAEDLGSPFFSILDSPMIMSSHVIFSREDSVPATLSRPVLQVLRQKSYSNIIITDDIQMQSITALYDYRIASLKALQAGCDVVLSVTKDSSAWLTQARSLHNYLLSAYKKGDLSEETLNTALKRILRIKLQYLHQEQWTIIPESQKVAMRYYQSHPLD